MRAFAKNAVKQNRPDTIREGLVLPRRQQYHPSPVDWRDEILYFLLIDRFSNGTETKENLLDRKKLGNARPDLPDGRPWDWDRWAASGSDRFQGGTLAGVKSKLGYLRKLGVSTIWLSPVFRQRGHADSYHGYGIQDFLDVDKRFGTRADLVHLVDAAHAKGIRVILDIIFNHSGSNWLYPDGRETPPYKPFPQQYPFGAWRDAEGQPAPGLVPGSAGPDDAVWPAELMDPDRYTRAGSGSLDDNEVENPVAEHKRTDFCSLRDFNLSYNDTLTDLALCYKYWIALTDCDGFRIDTLKHVSPEEARNFCGTIREYAENIGKDNFFLLGEVAGGDKNESRYLGALQRNMNAVLDIGEMRLALLRLAKGLVPARDYFNGFSFDPHMGSHRGVGNRHVSVMDDHDCVFGEKIRFAAGVPEQFRDRQVAAGTALQLFTLGIPCIYYGTEQAFAGPEPAVWSRLPGWRGSDRYLREAMFGPGHPRKKGLDGLQDGGAGFDRALPGFGPFGTAGRHCFDEHHPAFLRIAAMAEVRQKYPALRHGRQYLRQTRPPGSGGGFQYPDLPGSIVAWARILDDEEVLCILNSSGELENSAEIIVDANLNPPGSAMTVVLNTDEIADPGRYSAPAPRADAALDVCRAGPDAWIRITGMGPSSVLVLANHERADEGWVGRSP